MEPTAPQLLITFVVGIALAYAYGALDYDRGVWLIDPRGGAANATLTAALLFILTCVGACVSAVEVLW